MSARAMVLCAGLGTRLRPLTLELPKPLVPVGDRPLLCHLVERLESAGYRELVLNTHHLPDAFPPVLDGLDAIFHLLHEPEIRGTAGGVAAARQWLGEPPVIVWNGDILADPPLAELDAAAADGGLALAYAPRPRGEGTLGLDARGRVMRLRGRSFGEESAGGDYLGVAALGARCLGTLPERGCLIGDWAIPELEAGRPICAVAATGRFCDAGDPAAYLALNLAWLAGRRRWVGERAEVADGVELVDALVGAGATVTGSGRVERTVIWPGAVARAPLSDAIVTTAGRVVRCG